MRLVSFYLLLKIDNWPLMQGSTAYLITEAANQRPNQLRIFQHVVTLPCSRKKLGLQPGPTTGSVHLSLHLGLQCSAMTFTLSIKWKTEVDEEKTLIILSFSGLNRAIGSSTLACMVHAQRSTWVSAPHSHLHTGLGCIQGRMSGQAVCQPGQYNSERIFNM